MQVLGLGRRRGVRRGGYGYRLGADRSGSRAVAGWLLAALAVGAGCGCAYVASTHEGRALIRSKPYSLTIIPAAQAKPAAPRPSIRDYIQNAPAASPSGPSRVYMPERSKGDWSSEPARRSTVTYWRNCNEAWAAGAAPISRGEPGYRVELDGDFDGVACEPFHAQYRRTRYRR